MMETAAKASPTKAIFDAMKSESINGIPLHDIIGGGDPATVAYRTMSLLISEGRLNPNEHVLDIGCGCGRIATPLTQYLSAAGAYCGIDIVKQLIDFCNRHIATAYPNFRFATLAQGNASYDWYRPHGTSDEISAIDQACGDGTVGLCIATSLFTHLDADETKSMLAAINKALKPDGRAFLTFFVMDGPTRAFLNRPGSPFSFSHTLKDPRVFTEKPDVPRHAVAFELGYLASLFAEHSLYIDRILYGFWNGRPSNAYYQDIVLVRKMPT